MLHGPTNVKNTKICSNSSVQQHKSRSLHVRPLMDSSMYSIIMSALLLKFDMGSFHKKVPEK